MRVHLGQMMVKGGLKMRQFRIGQRLAVAAECFLQGYWNEVTEEQMDNGEYALLRKIGEAEKGKPLTVFDVGANHGQWAQKCLTIAHRRISIVLSLFQTLASYRPTTDGIVLRRPLAFAGDFSWSQRRFEGVYAGIL